jgi:hypothetical protein
MYLSGHINEKGVQHNFSGAILLSKKIENSNYDVQKLALHPFYGYQSNLSSFSLSLSSLCLANRGFAYLSSREKKMGIEPILIEANW